VPCESPVGTHSRQYLRVDSHPCAPPAARAIRARLNDVSGGLGVPARLLINWLGGRPGKAEQRFSADDHAPSRIGGRRKASSQTGHRARAPRTQ
jgi:hypothetical protein